MSSRLSLLAVVVVALVAALLPPQPGPVEAATGPHRVTAVFPGVAHQEWRLATPNGAPVAAQVVVVDHHPSLRVAPMLARGAVVGLEPLPAMAQRALPEGAVAGVNGGFWLSSPVGDPEGFTAVDGDLVSEAETQGSLPRGAFGVRTDGVPMIDRLLTKVSIIDEVDEELVEITGVNRLSRTRDGRGGAHPFPDGPDPIYLYTPEFGADIELPDPEERGAATVMVFEDTVLPAVGVTEFALLPEYEERESGKITIPEGGVVAVGYGKGGRALQDLERRAVRLASEIGAHERPERAELWSEAAQGVTGGPLLLRDGRMTDQNSWRLEGFSDGHLFGRAPRTAVGVTAEGKTLMVTVDGRQTDYSEGMTMPELGEFMLQLGAVEAVALDGGGSTQLTIDGVLRNRPCGARDRCGPVRSVANGLFVFHDYTFAHTERLAGAGRDATAAAVATAAYPDGADIVVLAAAGDFPDALAGGPLAHQLGAPLLLSGRDALTPVTVAAIKQLGARRVTILGGTSVISEQVEESLRGRGLDVGRIAGDTRLETAARIAAVMGAEHERVFVAASGSFADALTAAPPAGMLGAPILLTGRDDLPAVTREVVRQAQPREVIIVGGGAAVSGNVEQQLQQAVPSGTVFSRLAGDNRFGTAAAINRWAVQQVPDVDLAGLIVARGDTFSDALSGGPLAAGRRQLLMIVPEGNVRSHPDVDAYLSERASGPLELITLLGGQSVLSSHQQWQLDQLAAQ